MTAVVSPCGLYRYTLRRDLAGAGPRYLFAGINPSTAAVDIDDATSRKWRGFVTRWGGCGYYAVNPFAYRSTDVRKLALVDDPAGRDNLAYIDLAIDACDILVPCWGNRAKVPARLRSHVDTLYARLVASGKPVRVFGRTASGDPQHPLLLPYSTCLQPA